MRRLCLLCCMLLVSLLYADVDTKDGAAITTDTNMDGFSSAISKVGGQTVKPAWTETNSPSIQLEFDQTNATQTLDDSGNNYHGALKPTKGTGPTWTTDGGGLNKFYVFDGSDDYILEADRAIWDLNSGAWTLVAWGKDGGSDWNADRCLFGKWWDGSTRAWRFTVQADANDPYLKFVYRPSGGSDQTLSSAYGGVDSQDWHLYAVSFNATNLYEFSVDGVHVSTITNALNRDTNTQKLHVGKGGHSSSASYVIFKGSMDRAVIYKSYLSLAALAEIAAATAPTP